MGRFHVLRPPVWIAQEPWALCVWAGGGWGISRMRYQNRSHDIQSVWSAVQSLMSGSVQVSWSQTTRSSLGPLLAARAGFYPLGFMRIWKQQIFLHILFYPMPNFGRFYCLKSMEERHFPCPCFHKHIVLLILLLLLSRFSRGSTLCDPVDGSPPGSAVPRILQARTLEWVAISFSYAWKWKVKVKSLSYVWLFATLWTAAHQAPLPMGFSGQEYWSGLPLPYTTSSNYSDKIMMTY